MYVCMNKKSPSSLNSPKADPEREESKHQVAERYKEEVKKHSEFKEDMNQKFIELSYKMINVVMEETNKKLKELTKKVQNTNDKFTKDIWYLSGISV